MTGCLRQYLYPTKKPSPSTDGVTVFVASFVGRALRVNGGGTGEKRGGATARRLSLHQSLLPAPVISDSELILHRSLAIFGIFERFSHGMFNVPPSLKGVPFFWKNSGNAIYARFHGKKHIQWMIKILPKISLGSTPPARIPVSTSIITIFTRESQPKPSFVTGILGEGRPKIYPKCFI